MSSHHFVKEGQEPSLFIAGVVPFTAAKGLLEWSPKVIVAADALDLVLSWGIKVDVVITESKSETEAVLQDVFPVEFVKIPAGENFVVAGLNYLSEKKERAVNVLIPNVVNVLPVVEHYTSEMNIVFWSDHAKWTFHAKPFQKWLTKGSAFYLYKTRQEQQIKVKGVTLEALEHVVENDGIIEIFSEFPYWVVEKQIF